MYRIKRKLYPFAYKFLTRVNRFPLFVQIEPTTHCNLSCVMCEFSSTKSKGRNMTFEQFRSVIDSVWASDSRVIKGLLPKAMLFDLTGIGEPLMNSDFLKMLGYLKEKKVSVTFADNFTMMRPDVARRIIPMVDQIFVSFDGATKETYERIRKGAKFETVVENIKAFARMRNESGRKRPRIAVRYLVTSENCSEMPGMVRLAKGMGVDLVSFSKINTSKDTRNLEVKEPDYRRFKEEAAKESRRLRLPLDFVPTRKMPLKWCKRPFNSMYVTVEGFVLPCCFINQGGRYDEATSKHNMGNVFTQKPQDIWNSKKYREFRAMLSKGRKPAVCSDCYLYE